VLARRLTNNVVPKPKLFDPQNKQASSTLVVETTGEQLLQVLTQLWKEKGHDPGILPETTTTATTIYATPSTWLLENSYTNKQNLPLPPKKLAQTWLMTYLEGPNMLFCICDHTESLELFEALYDPQASLSSMSMCVIFWQITVGSRFAELLEERVHRGMYETAVWLLDAQIDEDTGSLLWLIQVLLLKCIYWLSDKNNLSWVTLGMNESSRNRS
jgi:hypothetical protein